MVAPKDPKAKVDDDLKVFSGTPASGEGLHLSMGAALVKALAPEPKMTAVKVPVEIETPLKFVDVNFHLGPTAMHFDYKKKQTVTLPLDGLSPELLNTLMSDFGAHLSEHDAHKIAKAWEAASLDFPLVGVGPDTCIPTHMCVVCGLKFLTTPVTQGKTFGAKTATCGMACWKKHKAAPHSWVK